VNYNGIHVLPNCLNSLLNTAYPFFDIIIVDNGSVDGSVEFIKKFKKSSELNITLIENDRNLGFALANNIGATYSGCKYIVFLNNDTIVDRNWLNHMVNVLERDGGVGAIQSLLLTKDGLSVDSLGGIVDVFGSAEDRRSGSFSVQKKTNSGMEEIFSACAAAVLIRKKVFEEVGMFDQQFFAYYEDVDLSWRIRLRGYSVILDRESVVFHLRSQTSKRFRRQLFEYHLYKNQLAMLFKNYGSKTLLRVLPVVGLLYFYRIINGLKRMDGYLAVAPLRAILWNFKNVKHLIVQRYFVQHYVRRVTDREIEDMMSKRPLQLSRLT
jgi:GT2 family glycosyltransferase